MGNTPSASTSQDAQSWKALHGCSADGSVEYSALEDALQNVRSERVRAEFFRIPEKQYTEMKEVRIWATTFNLNGRKPPDELNLRPYLKKWHSCWPKRDEKLPKDKQERADIYVMGFQEAVPLTAQNIIAGWTAAPAGWDYAIDRSLNPWKTEEEIVQIREQAKETSVIDFYNTGWSGIPSAHLEKKVQDSMKERERGLPEFDASNAPDLISFETNEQPSLSTNAFSQRPPVQADKASDSTSSKKPEHEEEFMQLFCYQLVGLYVSGWVRKRLLKRISGVQVTTVATGAMGYLANKGPITKSSYGMKEWSVGGIAVRLRIDDSCFVFITSHFASGSNEGDQLRRNLDFSEIVRRTQFPYEVELVHVMREDGTAAQDFSVQPEGIPENASDAVKRSFLGGKWGAIRNLKDLDNVIWLGDLNYRINATAKEVIDLIRADKLNLLLEVEQLSVERAAGRVFQNFMEAPIDFPPTYKFIRGTGYYTGEIEEESSSDSEDMEDRPAVEEPSKTVTSYPIAKDQMAAPQNAVKQPDVTTQNSVDQLSGPRKPPVVPTESSRTSRRKSASWDVPVVHKEKSKKGKKKKIRTPAWTDRILWYSSKKQLHQLLYGSFEDIHVSDHKPVIATFIMETRKFDHQKVEAALQEARRSIDVEEMASIPRCKLSPTVVDVGELLYNKPKQFKVTVTNIGEVSAVYSFVPANPGRHIIRSPFPTWLSVHPTSGVVAAGKKEDLNFTATIVGGQWGSADELFSDREEKLDHILVLHVEGGSDFFVSIVGTYTLSCFGLSLNNLAQQSQTNRETLANLKPDHEVKLPSMRYREKANCSSGWDMSLADQVSLNLDNPLPKQMTIPEASLGRSTSLAATGPKPNLVEGPTKLMIPSQVARMLYFLIDEDRLKTHHIFIESFKHVSKAMDSKTELPAVTKIREALDHSTVFPNGISAHDMASALFTFMLDLPSPMIPESVAQSCEMSDISAVLAISLVKEAMSAIEWSVFDSTMEVMRSALMDENTRKNHVTEATLANVLSQVFFQDIVKSPGPSNSIVKQELCT